MILSDRSRARPSGVAPAAASALAPKARCASCGRPIVLAKSATCLYCGAATGVVAAEASSPAGKLPPEILFALEPRARTSVSRGRKWAYRIGASLVGSLLMSGLMFLMGTCAKAPQLH
jgi:hypothetical protein